MKRILLMGLVAMFLLSGCQKNVPNNDVKSDNSLNKDLVSKVTEDIGAAEDDTLFDEQDVADNGVLNGLDYVLNYSSTPIYSEVKLLDNSSSGEAQTYDELVQTLYDTGRDFNFVKLRIDDIYSADDAFAVTTNNMFLTSATLFKATVIYDCLNNEEMNVEINLAQAGNSELQTLGKPLYQVGDEYVAYLLYGGDEGWWIAGQLCFAIHNVNGCDLAYQMTNEKLKLDSDKVDLSEIANLNLEMEAGEKSVVTSTSNNAVQYSYKMTEEALIEFILSDWSARGFDINRFTVEKSISEPEKEYYEANIMENLASGEPQSYDDLVEYLEVYSNLTFI